MQRQVTALVTLAEAVQAKARQLQQSRSEFEDKRARVEHDVETLVLNVKFELS